MNTNKYLKKIITESTLNALNEISWQTSDRATQKALDNGNAEKVLDYLSFVEQYLTGLWYESGTPNPKCKEMLYKLRHIKNFITKKAKQAKNLEYLNYHKFKNQHNGKDMNDFERSIPDDENLWTPEQREFMDYMWK